MIILHGYNPTYRKWKRSIKKNELESLLLLHLIPTAFIKINICDLGFHVIGDKRLDGCDNKVQNSPHVKLLKSVIKYGEEHVLSHYLDSEYATFLRDQKYKYNYFNGEKIPRIMDDKQILLRVKSFINVYKSIRDNGYLTGAFKNRPICILEKPFWNTRYGSDLPNNLHETFIGHHRLASLYVLEYKYINAVLLNDVYGEAISMEKHYNFLRCK